MKKMILLLLMSTLLLVLTAVPASADTIASGTCGDHLTWTLDSDGTLTISGTGKLEMDDLNDWYSFRDKIQTIVIGTGVTITDYWYFNSLFENLTDITVASGSYFYSSVDGVLFNTNKTELLCYPAGKSDYTIPNGVKKIGDYAFEFCSKLTNITIPSSVTSIGNGAFRYCTGLTEILIPASVSSIGDWGPFGNSTNLMNISVASGNKNYCSVDGVLFNKNKTKLIAFPCGKVATDYSIPMGVTSLGTNAFEGCKNLQSITIPTSMITIIGTGFAFCDSLVSITIPSSVTSIDDHAFDDCASLAEITVATENNYYCSDNGVLFNKAKTKLIWYPRASQIESFTIPSSMTSIDDDTFINCENLKSVTIPNSVISIGDSAFSGCSGLISVTIPDSVISIGDFAFSGCSNLISITIPDSVTSIGYWAFERCSSLNSVILSNKVTHLGDYAFYCCYELSSIHIPDSLTSIGESTFGYCYSLTNIEIPPRVTSLGDESFYYCNHLESITIPLTVTHIGENAFYCCYELKNIYYAGKEEQWQAINIEGGNGYLTGANITFCTIVQSGVCGPDLIWELDNLGTLTIRGAGRMSDYSWGSAGWMISDWDKICHVIIEEGVTSIGDYAYAGCDHLTSVSIPSTVNRIGTDVFQACDLLTGIDVAVDNENYYSADGVLYDKNQKELICYPAAKVGSSYTVPSGVTSIRSCAFYDCVCLAGITFPESLTWIGDYAFVGCSSLTGTISIPENVTGIGIGAFGGCGSLMGVILPEGISCIDAYTFWECGNLAEITIPDSVTEIGWYAFSGCDSLHTVRYSGSRAAWKTLTASIGEENDALLAAPHLFVTFINVLTLPASLTTIEEEALTGLDGVDGIRLPNCEMSIDEQAFDADMILLVPTGSPAARWAQAHSIHYIEE